MGKFQPSEFKDHYEAALKAMIKAKKAGRKIKEIELPEKPAKPSSVLEALREEPEARRPRASAPCARHAAAFPSARSRRRATRTAEEARLISDYLTGRRRSSGGAVP